MGRLSRENSTVIFSSVSYLLVIFIGRKVTLTYTCFSKNRISSIFQTIPEHSLKEPQLCSFVTMHLVF